MRNSFLVIPILLLSFLVSGCLGPKRVDNYKTMNVSFSFDTTGCALNSPSPEIKIENVPDGTAFFQVSMVDLDVRSFNHGGGTAENAGDGIIKKGALKGYKGPCPPSGTHTYEFTVKALNGDKSLLLGEGKARSAY